MHKHSPGRRAALARCSYGAEDYSGNREIEVRSVVHDDRVVATELQEALAHAGGDSLAHFTAHRCRTSERDERNTAIVNEAGRELSAGIDEDLEDRRKAGGLHHAVAKVLDREGGERCLGRRLPHRDVAADCREARSEEPT